MMIGNWPISKDDLYGPPPAYSITNNYENPPPSYTPSIYIVPAREMEYQERSSSHASIILMKTFTRYLLGSGLVHMVIGLGAIVCDIILTIMNESYSFTGLWTGALSIILGIYLILFMSHPEKRICSLQRLQFLHMVMCLISIIALILASINLASDTCYKTFLGPDRCQYSPYLIKIILVTFFSFMFVQICITIVMTFVHKKKARLIATRNDGTTSEIIG
jgi:succinate dehydrogenase hydrophobic anchor subunit